MIRDQRKTLIKWFPNQKSNEVKFRVKDYLPIKCNITFKCNHWQAIQMMAKLVCKCNNPIIYYYRWNTYCTFSMLGSWDGMQTNLISDNVGLPSEVSDSSINDGVRNLKTMSHHSLWPKMICVSFCMRLCCVSPLLPFSLIDISE